MSELIRSAYVIGRRDFTATVFSKAFIFFLLGPLFPVLLGALFGGIGARVATQAEQPLIAVVAPEGEFLRLSAAREELARAIPGGAVVQLVHVQPKADIERQTRELLASKRQPVVAVLAGGPGELSLTGAVDGSGAIAGQVRMLVTAARSPPPSAPPVAVSEIEQASGSVTRSHAVTAQIAQIILFFLTMILATMILSQLIEEKSNKVIEVLAAAAPIEAVFLGKLFAMLATSMLGIVVWVALGASAIDLLAKGGTEALPDPATGWPLFLLLGVVYFTMNYLLLGSVFLSIGAQASSAREVQILSMPATIAQVLIFGFAALAIGSPNSTLAIAGAVFPLSSPLVMLARAAEMPDLWPHLLAIAWQALWVGLIILASARLFRRTVLKSGPARRSWWRRAAA